MDPTQNNSFGSSNSGNVGQDSGGLKNQPINQAQPQRPVMPVEPAQQTPMMSRERESMDISQLQRPVMSRQQIPVNSGWRQPVTPMERGGDIILGNSNSQKKKLPFILLGILVIVVIVVVVFLVFFLSNMPKGDPNIQFQKIINYMVYGNPETGESINISDYFGGRKDDMYIVGIAQTSSRQQIEYYDVLNEMLDSFSISIDSRNEELVKKVSVLDEYVQTYEQNALVAYTGFYLDKYLEDNKSGIESYINSTSIFSDDKEINSSVMLNIKTFAQKSQEFYSLMSSKGCIKGSFYDSECMSNYVSNDSNMQALNERLYILQQNSRNNAGIIMINILRELQGINEEINYD